MFGSAAVADSRGLSVSCPMRSPCGHHCWPGRPTPPALGGAWAPGSWPALRLVPGDGCSSRPSLDPPACDGAVAAGPCRPMGSCSSQSMQQSRKGRQVMAGAPSVLRARGRTSSLCVADARAAWLPPRVCGSQGAWPGWFGRGCSRATVLST